jgi:peptide/nickel transport system substrate-binding protein
VRFHNGALLTADDVVWSWRRFLDRATNWKCRKWFAGAGNDNDDNGFGIAVASVEAVDTHRVRFRLREPASLFLDLLSSVQCMPVVVHPDSVDSNGNWREPIGTGPFRLARWKKADYVELERFDGYTGRAGERDGLTGAKRALVERVRFLVLPDPASARAALLSGGIDIYPAVPAVMAPELADAPDIELQRTNLLAWTVLLVQTRDPVLNDVRIRRAIGHAIDIEQLVGFTTEGNAVPNPSAVAVGHAMHTAVHEHGYDYDLGKARALLKDARYRGQVIAIQTNRKYPNMYNNALVIQAMLQLAGINARLEVLDWATQLSNYYSGKYQLMSFGYSALPNPVMRYQKLVGPKRIKPTYQWESGEAEAAVQRLLAATSPEERRARFEALHSAMIADAPIIGLYNAFAVSAVAMGVEGYINWPLNIPRLWGVAKNGSWIAGGQ